MQIRSPFKRHRFPQGIILLAVRWYCRYPLSYQDVVDLLAEPGVAVDRSTVFRWLQKFGPEIAQRTERHPYPSGWPPLDDCFAIPCRAMSGVIFGALSMPTASWLIFV